MTLRAALIGDTLEIGDATFLQRFLAGFAIPYDVNTSVNIKLREK